MRRLLLVTVFALSTAGSLADAAPRWSLLAAPGARARAGGGLAFLADAPSPRALAFGGCAFGDCPYDTPGQLVGATQGLQDGWVAEGENEPFPRWGMAFVALPGGRALMFGGAWNDGPGRVGIVDETWLYDGTAWSHPTPATHPGTRWFASAAANPATGHVYLFGGRDSSNVDSDETWVWTGAAWTMVGTSGTAPSRRFRGAMAWDGSRFVYFGGKDSFASDELFTLTCDGANGLDCTWAPVDHGTTDPWPAARTGHSMVWDPDRRRVVLFGGETPTGTVRDLWEWDGRHWERPSLTGGPSARHLQATTYDPVHHRVLVAGGVAGRQADAFADLWSYAEPTTAPDAGHPPSPDAGPVAEADAGAAAADADAGAVEPAPEDLPDGGSAAKPHPRYGCSTTAPAALLLLLPLALLAVRRRRRS